ncbi:GtrA family protein [Natronomonas halophila]|uniref:GtrA family protein n=1 Tax=Natronomonas halophila TaxID=2747817 RepID=UPI0015B4E217|nr:GtrA family protein [Natronomonas halophila]QLD86201.1 GtrA family protein [Natronomonas halophila]
MVRETLRQLVEGPLAVRLRRFAAVGALAAGVQLVLLWLLVDMGELNYIVAAFLAIETTIIFQYVLNNAWTFHADRKTERWSYVYGLVKTNIVRGSAIPIQLFVLYVFVAFGSLQYLVANAIAIAATGLYRYVLDARWTWS